MVVEVKERKRGFQCVMAGACWAHWDVKRMPTTPPPHPHAETATLKMVKLAGKLCCKRHILVQCDSFFLRYQTKGPKSKEASGFSNRGGQEQLLRVGRTARATSEQTETVQQPAAGGRK